jgi:serine/threonine protein phosphatase PrpC
MDAPQIGRAVRFSSGVATDAGLLRGRNEDRYWADDENGIFLVVDGVGGRAAGEQAAEVAVETIRESLRGHTGAPVERVRAAITAANNSIYQLAQEREDFQGMACVLTLALVEDDRITIGHVGDSRLYLIWNGTLRKLTSDHSPVGEREDRAELSEEEAMRHPRRHEVSRDVGSAPRSAADADFIETRECLFKPDAAILLCSDGLSDMLTAAEISAIIERYDGDPGQVAAELVDVANDAGGRDNVTVIFVAGPEFAGRGYVPRERHSTTRQRISRARTEGNERGDRRGRFLFFIIGLAIGLLAGAALGRFLPW